MHRRTFRGGGGRSAVSLKSFKNLKKIQKFSGSDKEIFGQNQNFSGNDWKNSDKIMDFRAIIKNDLDKIKNLFIEI